MQKVKVISNHVFLFGYEYKCSVAINKGQIWEVRYCPSESCPLYGLYRKGVIIQITKEQLERNFCVIWE